MTGATLSILSVVGFPSPNYAVFAKGGTNRTNRKSLSRHHASTRKERRMARIGHTYTLRVIKRVSPGAILDAGELGEVLLPNKYCPQHDGCHP